MSSRSLMFKFFGPEIFRSTVLRFAKSLDRKIWGQKDDVQPGPGLGVWSRLVVKVGPFCRKGLSPQGEPCVQFGEDCKPHRIFTCTEVAASREVPPGRRDLLEVLLVGNRPGFLVDYRSASLPVILPSLTIS